MKLRFTSLLLLGLSLTAGSGFCQNDLYDNGPSNNMHFGWTISYGYVVSDSFVLTGASTVNGLNFIAWLYPGDVLASAEVSISSDEFGGTTYFDRTVDFVQGGCVFNNFGYNACNESGAFSGVNLNPGAYWLNITHADSHDPYNPIYWDENDGPSLASENSVGTIASESFTLLGHATSTTTPEPASIILFGSGLLGIAELTRRKLF